MAQNIKPRSDDYPQWYLDVIKAGELADYSPVRGCMVIRPHGYAIWELLQQELDRRFKETGHVNAYFPLFIPQSFLAREAKHVEGFAMECAVVTHSGLEQDGSGGLRPKGKLEEPLVVRPTSETVIGQMYSERIRSWRDLPVLINQWANVVRWEMRTRLFLRTMEFLWQEGHTAHETPEEAEEETRQMLQVYADVAENVMALPVLCGEKTEAERFAGADTTYCIEAMMQDGKALQSGTSHNLGQNFSKAFGIEFQTRDQKLDHVWTTSWGVSTRLIGALIMAHSDDDGLILPPSLAPVQAAIVPIYKTDEERAAVLEYARNILCGLAGEEAVQAAESRPSAQDILAVPVCKEQPGQKIVFDTRDTHRPPEKFFHWEQRGVPVRIEVGPRDLKNGKAMVVTRLGRKKTLFDASELSRAWLKDELAKTQASIFERAKIFRTEKTCVMDSYDEFKEAIEDGGFFLMHWDGTAETETKVKDETKATIRLIPFDETIETKTGPVVINEPGTDPVSGKPSQGRVVYARAY